MAESTEAPKRAGGSKEKFVRTIGPREHYVGIGIICLTLMLCTWVLIRGLAPKGVLWGAYDAALFSDSTAAAPAAAAPAGPEPVYADPTEESASGTAAPAGELQLGFLPVESPAGWTAAEVETFPAATMYEKINGRAEAYVAYDVLGMECLGLTGPGGSVELFILDFGEPLRAFGAYSAERNVETKLELGQEGYAAGGSVYFWRQRYYVQVMDGTGKPEGAAAARALAEAVEAKLPGGEVELPGAAFFPADGLLADSLGWSARSALGQEFLDDTWTAKYRIGETEVEAFVKQCGDETAAAAVLAQYRAFLEGLGAVTEKSIGGVTAVIGENSGIFDIVFTKGARFGGVSYVDGREPAEAVIALLAAAP